jgi:RimJ/RimL family protein N-acetyltransferase
MKEFDKNLKLETPRLLLRGITINDADKLVEWRSREDVYKWCNNARPITMKEHLAWFERYLANSSEIRLVIVEKANNEKIGVVGGEYINEKFVLMYLMGEDNYRGRGYVTEALRALISMIVPTTVVAEVRAGNDASIRLLEKLGFTQESIWFTNNGGSQQNAK